MNLGVRPYSSFQMSQDVSSFVRALLPSTVVSLIVRLSASICDAIANSTCIAGIKYVFFIRTELFYR